jgi:hypothetical protein
LRASTTVRDGCSQTTKVENSVNVEIGRRMKEKWMCEAMNARRLTKEQYMEIGKNWFLCMKTTSLHVVGLDRLLGMQWID